VARTENLVNPLTTVAQTRPAAANRLQVVVNDRGTNVIGRKSDTKRQLWFRSSRVFASDGKWFFQTREGVDMGPYDSPFEAEVEAQMLMELLRENASADGAAQVMREFVLDSFEMGRPLAPNVKAPD